MRRKIVAKDEKGGAIAAPPSEFFCNAQSARGN